MTERGRFHPLGATLRDGGVNFALYSRAAEAVDLLLYDRHDGPPTARIPLHGPTRHVWHAFVPGLRAGQLYGYKVRGPFDPAHGQRFNPHKLLLDPYARAVTGKAVERDGLFRAYDRFSPRLDLSLDTRENDALVPKAIVVDESFDWDGDAPPDVPFEELVLYEVHVKGFTAGPGAGVAHPGTYLGFAEKIPHLVRLGVNAVELLPVHEHHTDEFLLGRGLTNYWGYDTLGYFAPESSYAAGREPGAAVAEFKTLVRELHRAGIEVFLDVVYNHTAEGNERGPTLSLRGIDNPSYYALTGPPGQPGRYYANWSGTGNCLDLAKPAALRLVMDSLRYWVEVMHVDGFRFDLASILGRENGDFRRSSSFFDAVSQDPVLHRVKLVAEPWDLGTYQAGQFPVEWAEWNGRFRDSIRRFARGDRGLLGEAATRMAGSSDLYGDTGRTPWSSVNFVTCHDGFTLRDLVTYSRKRNEANGEGNRDGSDDNHSWNCGAEGETADPEVNALRRRVVRNLACHVLFALGTPMILGGDELARTQRGNNNAYGHDGPLSWLDWSAAADPDLPEFFRRAIAFRRRSGALHRTRFFSGHDGDVDGVADVTWYAPEGGPPRWDAPGEQTLAYRIDGGEGARGGLGDHELLLVFHAGAEPRLVHLPEPKHGSRWCRVVDTSLPPGQDFLEEPDWRPLRRRSSYRVPARTTVLLIAR